MNKGIRTLLILAFVSLIPLYLYVGDETTDVPRPEVTRQTRNVALQPTPTPQPTDPPQLTPTNVLQPTIAIEPVTVGDALVESSDNLPTQVPSTQERVQPSDQTQASSGQPQAPVQAPSQPQPVVGVVVSENMDIDWYCRDTYGNYHAVYTGDFWACSDYQTILEVDLHSVANHNVDAYGLWVDGAPGYCAANLRGGSEGWGIITCWP